VVRYGYLVIVPRGFPKSPMSQHPMSSMCKNLDLGLLQALVQAPVMMMIRMAGKLQQGDKKENGLVIIKY